VDCAFPKFSEGAVSRSSKRWPLPSLLFFLTSTSAFSPIHSSRTDLERVVGFWTGILWPTGRLGSGTSRENFGVDEEYLECARLDFEESQNNEP
jgi:hypothetical protein